MAARILLLCGATTALLAPRAPRLTRTTPGASVVGLYGDWESAEGGSYLLEPPEGEAKGVVHFVGGAFIGAASQLTYRYLLERFAGSGYLVVATPFRLSFDYLSVCDAVEASYEAAAAEARRRGYDDALFDDVVAILDHDWRFGGELRQFLPEVFVVDRFLRHPCRAPFAPGAPGEAARSRGAPGADTGAPTS